MSDSEPALSILAYTTSWCPDCRDAHRVLQRSGLPYRLVDIESVAGADAEMQTAANGVRRVPTILIEGRSGRQVLVEPDVDELTEALRQLKLAETQ